MLRNVIDGTRVYVKVHRQADSRKGKHQIDRRTNNSELKEERPTVDIRVCANDCVCCCQQAERPCGAMTEATSAETKRNITTWKLQRMAAAVSSIVRLGTIVCRRNDRLQAIVVCFTKVLIQIRVPPICIKAFSSRNNGVLWSGFMLLLLRLLLVLLNYTPADMKARGHRIRILYHPLLLITVASRNLP